MVILSVVVHWLIMVTLVTLFGAIDGLILPLAWQVVFVAESWGRGGPPITLEQRLGIGATANLVVALQVSVVVRWLTYEWRSRRGSAATSTRVRSSRTAR